MQIWYNRFLSIFHSFSLFPKYWTYFTIECYNFALLYISSARSFFSAAVAINDRSYMLVISLGVYWRERGTTVLNHYMIFIVIIHFYLSPLLLSMILNWILFHVNWYPMYKNRSSQCEWCPTLGLLITNSSSWWYNTKWLKTTII